MRALDTNVLVRALVQDDPAQSERASALFRSGEELLIPLTVLLETEWVLRRLYKRSFPEIAEAFRALLSLPLVRVNQRDVVELALEWASEQGLDFADAMHLAQSQDAALFMTFDRRFVSRAEVCGTCRVEEP
ncbi:MAG: hypothetical protein RL318_1073 [Fibrobacterota bacterium]|jgi:predicted nucleic-acid-binding protein